MHIPALNPVRGQQAAAPAPPRSSEPPAPEDPLDRIDSPQEAALLPFLDPGLHLAMTMAGAVGAPGVGIVAQGIIGGQLVNMQYQTGQEGLSSQGNIGTQRVDERIYVSDSQDELMFFSGRVGGTREDLHLLARQGALQMEGRLGETQAHLNLRIEPGQGSELDITIEGTLNDQPYYSRSHMSMNENFEGTMTTTGQVGDKAIEKTYTIAPTGPDEALEVRGQGHIAGVSHEVRYTLSPPPPLED
ncbi:MAG TPA: hypothetical protein VNO81_08890 [Candidatus Nitrosotenuis sp.]|jgi:hypothetical protein|nr:hypothetical protein [Candidatus Nitrosotenuis sp.]